MANSGTDRCAIAKFMKDMQREFDRHPIRIPVEADGTEGVEAGYTSGTVINKGAGESR